jgi:prepilin-type processing-associated H-X9-DG protein
LPDQWLLDDDYSGNIQKVDHWTIGSAELNDYETALAGGGSDEASECLGSTRPPLNAIKDELSPINDKELSFGSAHPQGVNIGFADGHVRFMSDFTDREVWSALGTRAGGEPEYDFDN